MKWTAKAAPEGDFMKERVYEVTVKMKVFLVGTTPKDATFRREALEKFREQLVAWKRGGWDENDSLMSVSFEDKTPKSG